MSTTPALVEPFNSAGWPAVRDQHRFRQSSATNLKEVMMPVEKDSATGDKGGQRGISTPSSEHVEKQMEHGNPTPEAETSKRASQKGKAPKKGGKKGRERKQGAK